MEKINIQEKYQKFDDHWTPKKIAKLNGQMVYLAKVAGEFVWHKHDEEDELFMVQKGTLVMKFRDKEVEINPGEMLVVPKGVEHLPTTKNGEEVWLMLFEPDTTKHTGDVVSELTKSNYEWI